jgi:hypothetical protein
MDQVWISMPKIEGIFFLPPSPKVIGIKPVLPTSATAKYRRGSENENIVNIGENIGKYRKMSQGGKKYKNIHFFSIF